MKTARWTRAQRDLKRRFHNAASAARMGRAPGGFTIFELLLALVILAILVLFMLTLVDGATMVWSDAEKRSDCFREARAALRVMSRDLQNAIRRPNEQSFWLNAQWGPGDTNHGSNIFFLAAVPSAIRPGGSRGDVCEVGFYLAWGRAPACGGDSLNLYRCFRSNSLAFANLASGQTFGNVVAGTGDLLARNIIGLRIVPVAEGWTNFQAGSQIIPSVVEITLTALNREAGQKLKSPADWMDTNSPFVRRSMQTFTTRVHLANAR